MELAWHLVGNTLRDGRPIPADGKWLEHRGDVAMCVCGLHASRVITDALTYAPGLTVCRVAVADVCGEDQDKLVARRRAILWRVSGEKVLRDFARQAALSVIHLWNAPEVVRQYLETGDETLIVAARDAATAVEIASGDAAKAAAWAAVATARAAVEVAAGDAARAVARAAARDAARDAAWAAARAAAWDAARDAAWAAARDAAWDSLTRQLEKMLRKAAGNPDDMALLEQLT